MQVVAVLIHYSSRFQRAKLTRTYPPSLTMIPIVNNLCGLIRSPSFTMVPCSSEVVARPYTE